MKALLIDVKATGIVNLENIDFIKFDNVGEFKEIERKLHKSGKITRDYKYHVFENDEFIPAIFRVIDGFYNQMQEFNFERITYKELPVDEKVKEQLITKVVGERREQEKQKMVKKGLETLLYAQVDSTKEQDVISIVENLEKFDSPIVYTDYLNELV